MMGIRVKSRDLQGWDRVEPRLRYLIPEKKKKAFWMSMARKALVLNRKRIQAQKNLDGSSFKSRRDPGDVSKMLLKILGAGSRGEDGKIRGRQTSLKFGGDGILIRAFNPVAVKHHYGIDEKIRTVRDPRYTRMRMRSFRRGYQEKIDRGLLSSTKTGFGKEPVSDETKKILKKELGFKKEVWNQESQFRDFTESTAWFIIMEHRVRKGLYNPETEIELPARDVLGLNPEMDAELFKHADKLIEKYRY
ncbi:hypothetical protein KKI24_24435 [bacterium]|nr:hypothetical protein [bacterium]